MQVIREINADIPISSDTLNPAHLVPVFWEFVSPEDRADILKRHDNTVIAILAQAVSGGVEDLEEFLGDFLVDIIEALENRAYGMGLTFGAHEGDGACFGFWSSDED